MKKEIYAEAGIPVYWIVNLVDRQIKVYSGPRGTDEPQHSPARLCVVQHLTAGSEAPVVIDGREMGRIAVKDVLP